MSNDPLTIETATAFVSLTEPRLIEQRYKAVAVLTFENIHENSDARARLSPEQACAVMVVVPKEMIPDRPLSNEDHFRSTRAKAHILALAVVTDSSMMTAVSKLYFMYHPQAFETKVFEDENDARKWLRNKLEELRVLWPAEVTQHEAPLPKGFALNARSASHSLIKRPV